MGERSFSLNFREPFDAHYWSSRASRDATNLTEGVPISPSVGRFIGSVAVSSKKQRHMHSYADFRVGKNIEKHSLYSNTVTEDTSLGNSA